MELALFDDPDGNNQLYGDFGKVSGPGCWDFKRSQIVPDYSQSTRDQERSREERFISDSQMI